MKNYKYLLAFIFLTVSMLASAQMRALTSTYQFNGLLLNPAYAGSLNMLSVIAVHREQWINVEGAPIYQALTAHTSFNDNQIGTGLQITRDRIGVHDNVSMYGSYAYKIKTGIGIMSLGLQAGFDSRRSDYTNIEIISPTDPVFSLGNTVKTSPNFGTGLYFANPNMYVGISVPYLLENKTYVLSESNSLPSNSRESRYYYATGGFVFHLSEQIKLSPSVLIRAQEQSRIAYDISGLVIFDEIAYVGLSFRNSGDITFIGQLILNENFRVGYAYDANTNEIATETTGSHEILLNYRIKLRNYKKDPQCPVYF